MKKYEVVAEKPLSAFLETVKSTEKDISFIRVRVDTPFGKVYIRPPYDSREYITLDIVNKQFRKGE